MSRVAIVGCGVVGAMAAYELSRLPGLDILALEAEPQPAQGATGAALGLFMGVASQRAKGRSWRLRAESLGRYQTLLPELAALGYPVPHNPHGTLHLCTQEGALARWRSLQAIRDRQGWTLEIWPPEQILGRFPTLSPANLLGGVYSPQDGQVDPPALTQALLAAAVDAGVTVQSGVAVLAWGQDSGTGGARRIRLETSQGEYRVDALILTAGLGTGPLLQGHPLPDSGEPLQLDPVIGQGIRVQLAAPLGHPEQEPIFSHGDIHVVPLGGAVYGVAATVELPPPGGALPEPDPAALAALWQGAIAWCPPLAGGTWLHTWHGARPRPRDRPAPVLMPLAPDIPVFLATGHYRNGVFLAPATAARVRDWVRATLLA